MQDALIKAGSRIGDFPFSRDAADRCWHMRAGVAAAPRQPPGLCGVAPAQHLLPHLRRRRDRGRRGGGSGSRGWAAAAARGRATPAARRHCQLQRWLVDAPRYPGRVVSSLARANCRKGRDPIFRNPANRVRVPPASLLAVWFTSHCKL